jgi:probable HAF family extracellular repeat protein
MSFACRLLSRAAAILLLVLVSTPRAADADEPTLGTWDLRGDFGAPTGVALQIGPEGAWSYGDDVFATNNLSGFRVYNDYSAGTWKFATDTGPARAFVASDGFYSHETGSSSRAAVVVWTAPRDMDIAFQIEAWTPADGVQNTREHDISWRLYDTDGTTLLSRVDGIIGGAYQGTSYAYRWHRSRALGIQAGQTVSFWHSRRAIEGYVSVQFKVIELLTSSLTDLGVLGGTSSFATGINANGQIAGWSYTAGNAAHHAFVYSDGMMTDLGALGGSYSEAAGINDNGQVAGTLRGAGATVDHAFIWSSSGGMRDIGAIGGPVNPFSSRSAGISSRGMVVGACRRTEGRDSGGVELIDSRGFVWSDETGMLDIGRLPGDTVAGALQANARGEVIGWSGRHAFVWSAGEGMTDLGSLGGDYTNATGINDSGQIVGTSYLADNFAQHAFLYFDGWMMDLGTLGGSYSEATAINASGQIVGHSTLADGTTHAFSYSDGVMSDLGTLGGQDSVATAINASGQIVGYSWVIFDAAVHAFAYSDGMMIDLGTLGGSDSYATGISARGQVTGYAYVAGNSEYHAFLGGIPDTAAPSVACPSDVTAEATSPSGAVVTFAAATATDAVDPAPVVVATPASGSTFSMGTTTVTVTATDASGNVGSCQFAVTVRDTTAPTITPPADVVVEATSASGQSVSLGTATASDLFGATASNNAPATFGYGTTTVTWTATDAHGLTATATQRVTVRDTTAPTITPPADVVVEATSASGQSVTLGTATAYDVFGATATNDTPATFGLGTTAVTWTATDAHGLTAAATQHVTVRDTTAPSLTCPSNVTMPATSSAGATVTFSSSTSDLVDPAPAVWFVPASGSTFAIGTTTVTCTARDAVGNSSSCTFAVTVEGGASESAALADALAALPASGSATTDAAIASAIVDLDASADASLWIDGTHATASGGKTVFSKQQSAIKALSKIASPDPVVTQVIVATVALEQLLAQTAISDATARGGSVKTIAKAQKSLDAGRAAEAAGDWAKAANQYEAAWKTAIGA